MISAIPNTYTDSLKTFLGVLLYFASIYIFLLFLSRIGYPVILPDAANLLRFDAGVYGDVARDGYLLNGFQLSNAGVFALFPAVWHLLHLGAVGISIVNIVFFAGAITLLSSALKIDSTNRLLWLSTPSLYFMAVPYSEALFCFLISAAVYGIVKNIKWLVWIALFLVSMSRATAVFLIPALLVMELLSNSKHDIAKVLKGYLILYALPVLAGTFLFVLIQYGYTGQWFIYYKIQVKNLGHEFSWPILPFTNFYGSTRILWLSALAMVPCLLSLIIILPKIYSWLLKNKVHTDKIWLLTLTYFPIILFAMVFYNPKWGDNRTNLIGIHRYVFCSPFIFIFLHYSIGQIRVYQARHYVAMFFICNIVWLSVGSWWHLQYLLFYNCLTLMVFAYMYHSGRKTQWATYLVFAVNFFLQISLYQQYLSGAFTD